MSVSLRLPWPPSNNNIWRRHGNKTLLSLEARQYRQAVSLQLRAGRYREPTFTGRLRVDVVAHPPDHRRRDLDNLHKAPLDALQAAGVFADDGQIDDLRITRGEIVVGGRLTITVEELGSQPEKGRT